MKKGIFSLLIAVGMNQSVNAACRKGFVPDPQGSGVCMEVEDVVTNKNWVSDEKPSRHPEPAYQRGDVQVVDLPSCATEDRKQDEENAKADFAGKKAAGLIKK